MSWFKMDDRIFDNPKIAALSDRAKVAYLEGGAYCSRELTNGFLPTNKAKALAGTTKAFKELTPHLWEPVSGGFNMHDYLKYNPTRDQVLAERSAAQRRMFERRSGGRSGEQTPKPPGEVRKLPVNPESPSIPDPGDPVTDDPDPEPFGGGGSALRQRWEERIGPLGIKDGDELAKFERILPAEWIREAMDQAEENAEQPWPYFAATLKRCSESMTSPSGRKRRETKAKPGSARAQFLERMGRAG